MPSLDNLPLELDADSVLRAQAAEPQVIRQRQPDLVEVANRALREGLPLITAHVFYERRCVVGIGHGWLELAGGARLKGKVISQHLLHADEVLAILRTVGEAIERRTREVFEKDPVLGLALDGVGLAAL